MNAHPQGIKAKINAALSEQWSRREVDRVELDLPLPISANDLWRTVTRPSGKSAMIKTKRYAGWAVVAGNEINKQRPGKISGPYVITISVNRRRSSIDLGNAEKATSDALQAAGVVDNDRRAEEIHLYWSDSVEGMHAVIEPFRKATAA
jgi:crossover junction endodeoxyribonuclease RusA